MTTTPVPPFSAMAKVLAATMDRHGLRAEDACYLFEAYDEVPETMPAGIAGVSDWMDSWCRACAHIVLDTARQCGWNGKDATGALVGVHTLLWGSGEGPRWCPACGVYLREGFTECSIEQVVATWRGRRLTPDCLPKIVEGLDYYGDGLPFRCGACAWNGPFHPRWRAPDFSGLSNRAQAVGLPCCGCLTSVPTALGVAVQWSAHVQRWQAFRRLALRAYRHYGKE